MKILDKYGYPIEMVEGRPGLKILTTLIHGSIARTLRHWWDQRRNHIVDPHSIERYQQDDLEHSNQEYRSQKWHNKDKSQTDTDSSIDQGFISSIKNARIKKSRPPHEG